MQPIHRARIVIADDHLLVAEACQRRLEPQFEVVGIVTDGAALVTETARLRPDVVITDINMPLLDGLEAGWEIKKTNRTVKVIYLTMDPSTQMAVEAFRRSASGYIVKTAAVTDLVQAILKTLRNERYLSPSIDKDVVDYELRHGDEHHRTDEITDKQKQVLKLLVQGMSLKQASAVLNVKMGTVAFHKYQMMQRLGFKSNAELFRYAVAHQIMPPK